MLIGSQERDRCLRVSLPFQEFLLWPARLPEDWPSVCPPTNQMEEVYEKRGGGKKQKLYL